MTLLAIAHRAANSLPALRSAVAAGVDVVEADVHLSRGRLEVRHSKTVGPLPLLWDRGPWQLTPRGAPQQLLLPALLAAAPPSVGLMLDLKGVGRVGARTVQAVGAQLPGRPVLVCSRWWPSLDGFREVQWARPVLSCRNRAELARLQRRLRTGPVPYGVSLHGSLLTAPGVAALRDRVERVMTWGVDDLATLERVIAFGVNGIISNDLEVLRAVLAQR